MQALPLIHVGFHKTGTTWLQNCLFNREDCGYLSPWGNQAGKAVDEFIICNPFTFDPVSARQSFGEGLAEAAGKGLVAVVSNEALCGWNTPRQRYEKEVADRLYQTFPDGKILITIREQKGSILSHYNEFIVRGGYQSLEEYIGESKTSGFVSECRMDRFRYDLFVGYYQNLFGNGNVLVLPQEQLRSDREGFCQVLARFAGVPLHPVPPSKDERVSVPAFVTSVRRKLNRRNIGKPDWSKPRQSLEFRVARKIERLAGKLAPASWSDDITSRMKALIRERVGDYYREGNRELEKLTGLELAKYGYDMPDSSES